MFYHLFWTPWGWVPDVPSKVARFLKENSPSPCWRHSMSMFPELGELPVRLHYHSTTTSMCSPRPHSALCLHSCQAGSGSLTELPSTLASWPSEIPPLCCGWVFSFTTNFTQQMPFPILLKHCTWSYHYIFEVFFPLKHPTNKENGWKCMLNGSIILYLLLLSHRLLK